MPCPFRVVVFYDDLVMRSDRLEIPHPRASERGFVLLPLSDIAPDLVHPRLGVRISELMKGVRDGLRLLGNLDDLS